MVSFQVPLSAFGFVFFSGPDVAESPKIETQTGNQPYLKLQVYPRLCPSWLRGCTVWQDLLQDCSCLREDFAGVRLEVFCGFGNIVLKPNMKKPYFSSNGITAWPQWPLFNCF